MKVSSQEQTEEEKEAQNRPLLMYKDGQYMLKIRFYLILLFLESSDDEFPIEDMLGDRDELEVCSVNVFLKDSYFLVIAEKLGGYC